ncbi:MAG: hypothetical protein BWX80_03390 [Candidatus Hydrogenedentes bacterium ADurb.Bin101]|nr:MAG: hypothetical protein BWX80_03390 [Candidatus Hydrogenedentes bacterium ADurb.Bin101]
MVIGGGLPPVTATVVLFRLMVELHAEAEATAL